MGLVYRLRGQLSGFQQTPPTHVREIPSNILNQAHYQQMLLVVSQWVPTSCQHYNNQ